jgi:uncharacterized protein (TIGR02594 family)
MKLPKAYLDLAEYKAPRILLAGLATYGVQEIPGANSNPIILSWAQEVGINKVYKNDDTAWCGLWMAVVTQRAGYKPVEAPLWARNWAKFGQPADRASLGDILVFTRLGGGHVAVYVGENKTHYYMLGGNQNNQVNISLRAKDTLIAVRRPIWAIAQPKEVKPIMRTTRGVITTNEA